MDERLQRIDSAGNSGERLRARWQAGWSETEVWGGLVTPEQPYAEALELGKQLKGLRFLEVTRQRCGERRVILLWGERGGPAGPWGGRGELREQSTSRQEEEAQRVGVARHAREGVDMLRGRLGGGLRGGSCGGVACTSGRRCEEPRRPRREFGLRGVSLPLVGPALGHAQDPLRGPGLSPGEVVAVEHVAIERASS